jgi:hypothetical protein
VRGNIAITANVSDVSHHFHNQLKASLLKIPLQSQRQTKQLEKRLTLITISAFTTISVGIEAFPKEELFNCSLELTYK